jgi:trans-2,3-dihydro-3-hydroxyanthranilate isomerase
VFADYLGIPEDPATGSANGCLAGYLVQNSYFGEAPINLRVEQGYEIGRPSLLLLKAQQNGGEIDVSVGGKVILVARGNSSNLEATKHSHESICHLAMDYCGSRKAAG